MSEAEVLEKIKETIASSLLELAAIHSALIRKGLLTEQELSEANEKVDERCNKRGGFDGLVKELFG